MINTHNNESTRWSQTGSCPTFTFRAYGRTELALIYSPELTPGSAWRRLKTWIHRYPGLEDHLASLSEGAQRIWTPAQVHAIIDAIGEP